MIELVTVENATQGNCVEEHVLAIHSCCPVSKNPRPGSTLTITYMPRGHSLEVGKLYAYIHQFRGGLHSDDGKLQVRDMEGMICRVADDCAKILGREVKVTAHLLLLPHQEMNITCTKKVERECYV